MKALRNGLLGVIWVTLALPALGQAVFSHPVAGDSERQTQLAELAEAMREQATVEGGFIQTKHLEILSRPLVSKGRFALDAEGEFLWDIHEPFALTYHFRDGELTRTQDGEATRLAPADEPSLHGFFQFFSALFQLTDGELANRFERYFLPESETHGDEVAEDQTGAAKAWTLGLRPKDRRMTKVLEQLVVEGSGAHIKRVTLTEPGGDQTELSFSYQPDGE